MIQYGRPRLLHYHDGLHLVSHPSIVWNTRTRLNHSGSSQWNVQSSSSGSTFPNASNTGWQPTGVTLTPSAGFSISANNTVIDSLDVTGEIKVLNGVTGTIIRRSRIYVSGGVYAIDCKYSGMAGPVTIEDCEIISDPAANTAACLNLSDGCQILRNNISGSKQNINGSSTNVTIQDNWMHDLVNVTGAAHNENIYISGSAGNTLISHNALENPLSQTANIFLDSKAGSITGVTIQNNLLAGGGYCIYGGGTLVTNVDIVNNQFSRLIGAAPGTQPYTAFWANGGQFGPYTSMPSDSASTVSGNVWADNGSPA